MKFLRTSAIALTLFASMAAHAAVTATFFRNSKAETTSTTEIIATATLSGTYATGGFTWAPLTIAAGPGSSPAVASVVFDARWVSPLGYIYVTTFTTSGFVVTATTKIFTAPNTELTNGTTVPDTTIPVILITNRR